MLEAKHLTLGYTLKEPLFSDVSFRIPAGKITVLLGENGIGKSTLFKAILRLLPLQSGELTGIDTKKIGFLLNKPAYHPWLTVRDELQFWCNLKAAPDGEVQKLLEKLDLTTYANVKCAKLSQGTLQRLGIATALVSKPKLLLLDEPFNGLDPGQSYKLKKLLESYCKENFAAIVISTHLLADAADLADQLLMITSSREIKQEILDTNFYNTHGSLENYWLKTHGIA